MLILLILPNISYLNQSSDLICHSRNNDPNQDFTISSAMTIKLYQSIK